MAADSVPSRALKECERPLPKYKFSKVLHDSYIFPANSRSKHMLCINISCRSGSELGCIVDNRKSLDKVLSSFSVCAQWINMRRSFSSKFRKKSFVKVTWQIFISTFILFVALSCIRNTAGTDDVTIAMGFSSCVRLAQRFEIGL